MRFDDIKDIHLGDKQVKALWLGGKQVWPAKLQTWVQDYETPGTWDIEIPTGARFAYIWLSAGGNAGQHGDGAWTKPGLGGQGGNLAVNTSGIEIAGATKGTVTIGRGGDEPNYQGGQSTISLASYRAVAESTNSLFASGNDGSTFGWAIDKPTVGNVERIPGMTGDGKINYTSTGLWNGPAGTYSGGNGSPGVRGGGGSGGQGGILGKFYPGGKGGDGFCRIVFTNRKI